ncbi:hypothetical protein KR51_00027270 [Rubidibacter lacunae KORDI 51-2]|uniref:Uncharacterized protein n=1 Tax=Rubidibacter lacunae KORDI 51-2 TaxID=582515 RepID=U5DLZ9_9CHRO|nr:hypothetical protein [Rubidibacter lacunae]ERN40740.1 hypothetical protein KR51_00027270 [Rubidibacter lacunae KORDI 51-2]
MDGMSMARAILLVLAAGLPLASAPELARANESEGPVTAEVATQLAVLRAMQVDEDGVFFVVDGQVMEARSWRSPDRTRMRLELRGTELAAGFTPAERIDLRALGVSRVSYRTLVVAGSAVQIDFGVAPDSPDWNVITTERGIALIRKDGRRGSIPRQQQSQPATEPIREAIAAEETGQVPFVPPPTALQSALLRDWRVEENGMTLVVEGEVAEARAWRSPDRTRVRLELRGVKLAPGFPPAESIDLTALGVGRVSYRTLTATAAGGSAVQFDLSVAPDSPDWDVVMRNSAIGLVRADRVREPIALTPAARQEAEAAERESAAEAAAAEAAAIDSLAAESREGVDPAAASPLYQAPGQPTAEQYARGDFSFNVRNRLFVIPDDVVSGTPAYPNFGFTWGVIDDFELNLEFQRLDTASPGDQGEFRAIRDPDESNFFFSEFQELTVETQYRIWDNSDESLALGGVLAVSFGSRPIRFTNSRGFTVEERTDESVVPSLQFPLTARLGDRDRWRLTVSPTVAFFPSENAMHLHQPPDSDEEFGTTFGVVGATSFRVNRSILLFADAFVPVTGNNAIDRDSGDPSKTIAFNAGLRYLVNPNVALDLYATNTLGTTGPLSLTADKEYAAVGANLTFLPSFFAGNRRYSDSFDSTPEDPTDPRNGGFAFFDGSVLPSGQFAINLGGGSQGFLTALRYTPVRDLEVGIYLDLISGEVDESEQGISGKLRVLDQQAGDPLTASLALTLGITNEPFVNFFNNNRDEFDDRGLSKSIPGFLINQDDFDEGQLYIATLSLPLHYQFANDAAVWFTPIVAFVQQGGADIAGFNLGGSYPVARNLDLIAEVGANFTDLGNGFDGNRLGNQVPYSLGLRWDISTFFGNSPADATAPWLLEFYLTNRVGGSTFHNLRVRDKDLAVGVGLTIPFRF